MSIARELGLEAVDPVAIIGSHWTAWTEQQPDLQLVKVPAELQGWLERGRSESSSRVHAEINSVLRALAILAADDGGDDPDAAMVVAWVMMPAACAVAIRNQGRAPHLIDQIVAARLWITVRSFPWRTRHGSVAANIARDLQRAVADDLDVHTYSGSSSVAPEDPQGLLMLNLPSAPQPLDPARELVEVLDGAIDDGVITWGGRQLLLSITDASPDVPVGRKSRGGVAGLLTAEVERVVAQEYRAGGRSVRRKAAECVTALARAKGRRG